MSLLLDALKRAEEEKRAREAQGGTAPAAEAPAQPVPAPKAGSLELASLEPLHAGPAGTGAPPPAAASAAPAKAARAGAEALFAAKARDPLPAARSHKAPLIAAAVAVALLVVAGGGWVWYQINAMPRPMAASPVQNLRPVTPAAPAPVPAPAPTATAAATPPAAAPAPDVPPIALVKPGTATVEPRRSAPPPRAAEQLVMQLLRERPAAAVAPPLRLARSMDPPKVVPDISAGYDALKAGDLPAARRRYAAAAQADPASADAALGLATVEARSGNRQGATRHYRRVLELDPANQTALAGLAALADFSQPGAVEGSLKADIARYPNSAPLHFALGNLYASAGRWADAQPAFFEAHRLDPNNADILHNLAVSLDHLAQSRLAADYYRRALARAGSQAVQFDPRAAQRRLAELGS